MNRLLRSILIKLFFISGTGTGLLVAAASVGLWLSWNSISVFEREVGNRADDQRAVSLVNAALKSQLHEWKNVLLRGHDPAALEKYWNEFEKQERLVQEQGNAVLSHMADVETRTLMQQFLSAHRHMGERYRQGLQVYKDKRFDSGAGDGAVKGADRAAGELLAKLEDTLADAAHRAAETSAAGGYHGVIIAVVLMAAVILVAFVAFVWMVSRAILRPARQLVADLNRLAGGDFSVPVRQLTQDEIGEVAASAERIRKDLGAMVGEINRSVQEVSSAATQLSSAAVQVSTSSSQQSEAASAAASAVEEMSVSIASVTESAEEVRRLSGASAEHTQLGNERLSELVGEIEVVETAVNGIATSVNEFMASTKSITTLTQ